VSNNIDSAVEAAFRDQGKKNSTYSTTDNWKETELKKGEKIAQIEFRSEEDLAVNKGPNSKYFIKADELEKLRDKETGKVDARKLAEAVQVAPYYTPTVEKAIYSEGVSIYKVEEKIEAVATSEVENNIALGKGGAQQYRTKLRPEELSKQGLLIRVGYEKAVNREHQLPVFKKIEKEIKEKDIVNDYEARTDLIGKRVYEYQQNLIKIKETSDNEKWRKEASESNRLTNKSASIRGEALPYKQRAIGKISASKEPKSKSSSIER